MCKIDKRISVFEMLLWLNSSNLLFMLFGIRNKILTKSYTYTSSDMLRKRVSLK
jgi:hypothetical protein